uniref:Uncharacterized protein n=1 Tax=Rhizophora mucronata TaxID=61149 RepID=A0A2P2KHF8_RHIMU
MLLVCLTCSYMAAGKSYRVSCIIYWCRKTKKMLYWVREVKIDDNLGFPWSYRVRFSSHLIIFFWHWFFSHLCMIPKGNALCHQTDKHSQSLFVLISIKFHNFIYCF